MSSLSEPLRGIYYYYLIEKSCLGVHFTGHTSVVREGETADFNSLVSYGALYCRLYCNCKTISRNHSNLERGEGKNAHWSQEDGMENVYQSICHLFKKLHT